MIRCIKHDPRVFHVSTRLLFFCLFTFNLFKLEICSISNVEFCEDLLSKLKIELENVVRMCNLVSNKCNQLR